MIGFSPIQFDVMTRFHVETHLDIYTAITLTVTFVISPEKQQIRSQLFAVKLQKLIHVPNLKGHFV